MKLEVLAEARREFEEVAEEWRAVVDSHPVKEKYESARARLFEMEQRVRDEVVTRYKDTGEKKFEGGCGVRIRKGYQYDDSDAIYWAFEHKLCLKIDHNLFKRLCAVEILRPDFVEEVEIVTATIPTRLDV